VIVLGFSRYMYIEFTTSMNTAVFVMWSGNIGGVRPGSDRAIPEKSSGCDAHLGRPSQPPSSETLGGDQQ
jgi:hypothetical protein